MRSLFRILILPVVIMVTGFHVAAQTGSLGDPIFTYDFGSGQNPGPPLPNGITNLTYTSGNCPDDGFYTLINSFPTSGAPCQPIAWHQLTGDHTGIATGSKNGYMMLINASLAPNVFFTYQTPKVLCSNTNYQFSAYILNLITPALAPSSNEPNITFTVTAPDGTVLNTSNTGSIPSSANAAPWVQYHINFNSSGYSYVIVTMTNSAPGGSGNDLVLDDISVSAYGPTITPPQAAIGTAATICAGESQQPSFTVFVPNGAFNKVQWQENINGAGWADLPNETTNTLTRYNEFQPAKVGTYQYRLGVAIGDNINSPACRVYSPPATITVNPLPVIGGLQPTESACAGSALALMAAGDAISYQWTGPNLPPTNANPLILNNLTAANAGTYTVTAFSQYGCKSTMTTKLSILPKAVAMVSGNTRICQGDSTQLKASGGVSYLWSPGSTLSDSTSASPFASPNDNTTYKVIVTNANNCQDSAKITVDVLKAPVANAGQNHEIFEGQSVQLNGTVKYAEAAYWTPATALSDANTLNPIATPAVDTRYTLHALSANNCGVDTNSIFIKVYQKLNIPNTFTPNNDSNNDTWQIDALITYPNCSLLVFNRYGQQVFKSTGYIKPWDGTYEGKPVPSGAYYYVLDLKDNKPPLSGCVMVVR